MPGGERFNIATHLLGAMLAVAGSAVLVTKALQSADTRKLLCAVGFGVSMMLLYGASTLFHGSRGPRKARLAKVDHCAIYLLIAGTYMPFALVTLRGAWGWSLFAMVCALALVGIGRELWWGRAAPPPVPLYLAMGWLGIAALDPLIERLDNFGLYGLLAGALLYTTGVMFYRLDARMPHAHGVWHLFVLGGTSCHYFAVLESVV